MPIRHALTLGEMVCLFAQVDLGPDGALSTLPVLGWERVARADRFDRPFVLPSPNMPTVDTALVYPGGCLIEGTNLSEARGHTRPFEFVGAPFVDGGRLAAELHEPRFAAAGIDGFVARPVGYMPTFHKHAGTACGGVQIHVTDPERFKPVATYVALIALAQRQAPDAFAFRTERYEFVDDIPAFDLLTGSPQAREAIVAGEPVVEIALAVSQPDASWPERMAMAAERLTASSW